MPTATKSVRTKNKKDIVPGETAPEETEGEVDVLPSKNKKPLEIDELEPATVVEEKVEEDPLVPSVEDDELASEEMALDTEDLNPFGDRWEE